MLEQEQRPAQRRTPFFRAASGYSLATPLPLVFSFIDFEPDARAKGAIVLFCSRLAMTIAVDSTPDVLSGLGARLAELFHKTIEALRDITLELPDARTPQDAADIVLKEDRKLYIGIILVTLAVVAVFATSSRK